MAEKLGLKHTFRALRHRNYRLFFIGQSISLIGTWMQQVAVSWLVYRMTNSPFLLGVVGFASQIPTFFVTPIAGVVADKYDRHRLLVITQLLLMAQASILAVLVLTNSVKVWHILALSVFLGTVHSFDIPVRQSFIVKMIEKRDDLGNAIALNSSMFNVARLAGPSLAGIIIAVYGEGMCFLINALSYIAVIVSLLAMRIERRKSKPENLDILRELKEGFKYAFGIPHLRLILLFLGLISLIAVPYQTLMPVFARDVFHGGPRTLGFLVAMSGAGALLGAIYLAGRKSVMGLEKIIAIASGLFGLGIIVFACSRWLWFSMAMILVISFGVMVQMAASNTVLQTIVEDDKRGRIMSFYAMSFMGMAPFGSLLTGGLAEKIGAPATLFICGVCCVMGSFIFGRKLLKEQPHPLMEA